MAQLFETITQFSTDPAAWHRAKQIVRQLRTDSTEEDFSNLILEMMEVEPLMLDELHVKRHTTDIVQRAMNRNGNSFVFSAIPMPLASIKEANLVPGIYRRELVERCDGLGFIDQGLDFDENGKIQIGNLMWHYSTISCEYVLELANCKNRDEMCAKIVSMNRKHSGDSIFYADRRWSKNAKLDCLVELMLPAVEMGYPLRLCPVKTLEMCQAACWKDPSSLEHVPLEFQSECEKTIKRSMMKKPVGSW